jgi:hypothetical protein
MKEKGQKKKELRSYNLHQLLEHLQNQFNRLQSRSLEEICDLIKTKQRWSSYVDEIWKSNILTSTQLPYAREVFAGQWEVASDNAFTSNVHNITRRNTDHGGIPTCDCRTFTSCLIACPKICTVFGRISDELLEVHNLHARWHISRHPLYKTALSKLNLVDSSIPLSLPESLERAIPDSIQNQLDRSSYDSIVFPSKRDVRYTKLNQEFKELEGKIINNEHWYKLMMMNLASFGNFIQGNGKAPFMIHGNPVSPLASLNESVPLSIAAKPPLKRGRSSNEDENMYYCCFRTSFEYSSSFCAGLL